MYSQNEYICSQKMNTRLEEKILQTAKKQKVIAVQEYINKETGEVVPMQVVSVEDRDFNFHKMWLQNFILATSEIRNAKMDLVFWLIDQVNKENQIILTQREISEKANVSLSTVQRTMQVLLTSSPPFLYKINSGAYQINPAIIWKGSHTSRMGQVFQYEDPKG